MAKVVIELDLDDAKYIYDHLSDMAMEPSALGVCKDHMRYYPEWDEESCVWCVFLEKFQNSIHVAKWPEDADE